MNKRRISGSSLDPLTFDSMYAVLQSGMWLLNDLETYLRPFHMSQGRLSIMISILNSSDGCIHPADIALITGKSRPTISKMIGRLVGDGFLRKLPYKLDSRSTKLEVTPEGHALLDAVVPGYNDRIRRMTRELCDREKRLLIELTSKIDFLDSRKKLG